MNIAVIGSRTFEDYIKLEVNLHHIIYEENEGSFKDITIISGGARGADSLAFRYALKHHLPYRVFEAEWGNLSHPDAKIKVNKYGKKYDVNAGFRRNTLIVENAHLIVAFHNNSPGTLNSIGKAKSLNKKVIEIYV